MVHSGCYLYAFTCYFLGLAGIFTIAAIAVLRYITTCKIASSTLTITRRTSWQVMFACYATAFLWALLPLAQIGGYTFEPFGLSCTLDWLAVSTGNLLKLFQLSSCNYGVHITMLYYHFSWVVLGSQLYISFVSFFCVAVPTLLILYSYVAILLNIRQKNALTENIGIQRKRCELQLTLVRLIIYIVFFLFVTGFYNLQCLLLSTGNRTHIRRFHICLVPIHGCVHIYNLHFETSCSSYVGYPYSCCYGKVLNRV